MSTKALDLMRAALDHMDPTARLDQLSFFRHVLACGPDCVPELTQRVSRVQAPPMFKQLVLEAAFYHPWPQWMSMLAKLLQYENDPGRFEVGAKALGSIGTPESVNALKDLHTTRHGAPFEEILAQELRECDPDEAFHHAFAQLLEGTGNPRLANEAAYRLAQLVDATRLEALKGAFRHPDLLVFRHGLQLLSRVATPEAAQTLKEILAETHQECLEDRAIKEALATLKGMAPVAALEELNQRLEALPAEASRTTGYGGFLQSMRAVALENKLHRLQAAVVQGGDDLVNRSRRQAFAVDATAEGAADLVLKGLMEAASLMALLREAFREHTGREGVARALGRLLSPGDSESQQLILAAPDPIMRSAAVEAFGLRRDPALRELLVQFCKDPVSDIADCALIHLGSLPDREDLAHRFLQTPTLEDQLLGLRFIAQEHLGSLTEDLLELIQKTTREDLALPILSALGAAGTAAAAAPLLELLHSGQSRRMQVALAETLRDLATPEIAVALGEKADGIKSTVLHRLAVEAILRAWKQEEAMPEALEERLLHHVQEAWNGSDANAFRLRLAGMLKGRRMESKAVRGALGQLFHDALAAGKAVHGWNPTEMALVQQVQKDFQQS